jgi:hypothetical protein
MAGRAFHLQNRGNRRREERLITLAVNDRLLERLLTFDASAEDLEDGGDHEPDDHDEADAPPC